MPEYYSETDYEQHIISDYAIEKSGAVVWRMMSEKKEPKDFNSDDAEKAFIAAEPNGRWDRFQDLIARFENNYNWKHSAHDNHYQAKRDSFMVAWKAAKQLRKGKRIDTKEEVYENLAKAFKNRYSSMMNLGLKF